MNELALFAGAGGGILGGRLLGWRTVCAVEFDPYRRSALLARQRDGILEPFAIWDDVRTFDGRPWRGHVDVISGGFPCQAYSTAGAKAGVLDERHLWPTWFRLIRESRPVVVFGEQVADGGGYAWLDDVGHDLEGIGYALGAVCTAACGVGAPHERQRLYLALLPFPYPRVSAASTFPVGVPAKVGG